jgi:hypothetical protein
MADKQLLVGSIDLSLLKGAHIARGSDGKESVVIPVADNPTIFLGAADKGGHIYMDIEVRESPENQYGHTHFIKVSVGKKKRETLSQEELREATPIVGNLREIKKRDGGDMPADL